MPIDDAIPLFGGTDKDVFLEIILKNPANVENAQKEIQNLFSDYWTGNMNEDEKD